MIWSSLKIMLTHFLFVPFQDIKVSFIVQLLQKYNTGHLFTEDISVENNNKVGFFFLFPSYSLLSFFAFGLNVSSHSFETRPGHRLGLVIGSRVRWVDPGQPVSTQKGKKNLYKTFN